MTTPEFHKLTKTNFEARMKEATKSLANKTQVDAALDMALRNRKKKKLKNFMVWSKLFQL